MSLSIPPEERYGEVEIDLIDFEPPGLFPTNQDSVWGQVRKVYADYMQENFVDVLAQWYVNLDPNTVNAADMDEWEYMLGIPNGAGLALERRRAFVLARMEVGPFTYSRRERLVELMISLTFGQAAELTLDGLSLDGAGVPLYSGLTDLAGTYRIYEDVPNYSYQLVVLNSIPVEGLDRELRRITPAGITLTVDNTVTNVLDYPRTVRNDHPTSHWRLGSVLTDAGPYGYTLTAAGAPATLAAPGLLVSPADKSNGGTTLNGTSQSLSVAAAPMIDKGMQLSIEAWVRPAGYTAANWNMAFCSGAFNALGLFDGYPAFAFNTSSGLKTVVGPTRVTNGQKYHLVGAYDGQVGRLYVNGVLVNQLSLSTHELIVEGGAKYIGSNNGTIRFWNGDLDEVAVYDHALPSEAVLQHYNTGRNVP